MATFEKRGADYYKVWTTNDGKPKSVKLTTESAIAAAKAYLGESTEAPAAKAAPAAKSEPAKSEAAKSETKEAKEETSIVEAVVGVVAGLVVLGGAVLAYMKLRKPEGA